MKNPYAKAQVTLANGDLVSEMRYAGTNERMISSSGEFNAYDKKQVLQAISQMFTAQASGQIVQPTREQLVAEASARREAIVAAYADDRKWAALGADLAVKIEEQRNREGFMRRLALGQNLKQGELPRVNVQMWDATAVVATGPANVGFQMIRNKQFFPAEFEITANVRVESLEIEQVGADTLDNAYNQGLDSIMVAEDKLWKQAADRTVGVVNPLNYIAGQLSPKTLAELRTCVTDWNLPVSTALIANDFWNDIIGNNEFADFLDPVTKYDLVLNGELGTLAGLNLLTDGFRQPNQKVLNRGEIYVVASPENHACYSDRGGVRSQPTDGANQGNTTKGWLMSEIISFVLANPRSIAKGRRI